MTSKIENERAFRSGRFILLLFAIIALAILYSPRLFGGGTEELGWVRNDISEFRYFRNIQTRRGCISTMCPSRWETSVNGLRGKCESPREANSDGMKKEEAVRNFLDRVTDDPTIAVKPTMQEKFIARLAIEFAYDPSRAGAAPRVVQTNAIFGVSLGEGMNRSCADRRQSRRWL